jgi:hypothetical protein
MTARRSATETEIPLYLIPTVIARQIKLHGGVVHRISVKRTCKHHYNITVHTKSLNREFNFNMLFIMNTGPNSKKCVEILWIIVNSRNKNSFHRNYSFYRVINFDLRNILYRSVACFNV